MRTFPRMLLALFALHFVGQSARPDDAPLKNYFVFPITTDLQRALMHSTKAHVYAEFDVASATSDSQFDLAQVDIDGFRAELFEVARRSGIAKPTLQLYFRYANIGLDQKQRNILEESVATVCRKLGYGGVGKGGKFEGGTWHEKMAMLARLGGDDDAEESAVENDFASVYPVRTKLSRFLLGRPDYDCYIELQQPIDGRFREFSAEAKQQIAESVDALKLPQRRRLRFKCMTTEAGRKSMEDYFIRQAGQPALVDEFLREIGFESSSISNTPMGVRPEELLDNEAPDFTLASADGGQFRLHEAIEGKVAVVAFWGVACGPCCVEAPHLTELYNRHKDNGLYVVGVNGYDEDKDVVTRFLREKNITHPIALQGKQVAREQYTVRSYPVTYFIDHQGRIVDYHLGFAAGDEKHLSTVVERLLTERENDVNQK